MREKASTNASRLSQRQCNRKEMISLRKISMIMIMTNYSACGRMQMKPREITSMKAGKGKEM
jgi:hypothetical protein